MSILSASVGQWSSFNAYCGECFSPPQTLDILLTMITMIAVITMITMIAMIAVITMITMLTMITMIAMMVKHLSAVFYLSIKILFCHSKGRLTLHHDCNTIPSLLQSHHHHHYYHTGQLRRNMWTLSEQPNFWENCSWNDINRRIRLVSIDTNCSS